MSIVIPRSVWQPRYDNGVEVIGIGEWLAAGKELWLHHSITNPFGPDATLEQDCQHMRDFEAIGEARFGSGISYTWVVMPSGRVFEGHSIDRQGTHTYQRNNRSRAICLAGNYDVNALPTRMIESVALLLRELGATLDGGHRDVYATACPGRFAYPRIGEINTLATSGTPIGGAKPKITGEDTMFLKILDGPARGTYLLLSGGLLSGLDAQTAQWAEETNAKAGGALLTGITDAVFKDLRNKSQQQETIGAKLDRLAELLTPEA